MHAVAVAYLEWIRWIATGWFRCADRVVWLGGADDQQGVDALMDRTPDLQVSDDQGYVIACLNSNALMSDRRNGRERTVGQVWLSIAAVSSFHPLSSRGARLLEADAERAAVTLCEPIFEKTWGDWRDRQLEEESHWRGLSLCAALGLKYPASTTVPSLVGELLSGRKTSSNSADVRNEALEGTRALGWSAAMTFAVRDPSVKDAFKAMPEYEDVRTKTKLLRQDFDLKSPLLNDESMIGTVRRIDKILTELGVEMLPVEVMAVVLHYRNLALRARDVSLESLLDDLATIAVQDPQNASLSAYFIGRSMENVAVTTLLYQSDADRYPALAHSVKQRLNVMGIVSARIEAAHPNERMQQQNARSDSIDENEKSSIDETIDITSSSSDSDRIDETRSDIDRKSKDLNELEGSFASSIQSLDEGSLSKAPIQSSLITSENTSFAEDYQLSSSGVNDVSQAQILNLERKSDVLQSTAEGIDPIIAFGGKKMRKKRAKTNNASAIMSATETSGERSNK